MIPRSRSPILRGCKIILREKTLSDAPMDFAWASDAELMRLDAAECIPLSYSIFLTKYIEGLHDPTKQHFAIETLDGRHIGNCVCYNFQNLPREAELGIVIGDREYWEKGYGADAVATLARYMFEVLHIERICLHTLTWNVRAQRCFRKCGFLECNRVTRNGNEFVEMELYRNYLRIPAAPREVFSDASKDADRGPLHSS